MSKAKQLLEAIYKVYNPQEENKETARTYDSENLRNMFIGTIFGGEHQDTIKNLRDCINKMSDDWVAEFLKVINGDVVEQVNESETMQESVNEEKTEFQVGDFIYDTIWKAYGVIREIIGDTAIVDLKRAPHGRLNPVKGRPVLLACLKDGNACIEKEINRLKKHIQIQENIRTEIMAIAKGEV